jgi:hypothetical protein
MGVHLGVWRFIPSHYFALPTAQDVITKLPSWPTTLQTLALVTSPRLGLRQWLSKKCLKFSSNNNKVIIENWQHFFKRLFYYYFWIIKPPQKKHLWQNIWISFILPRWNLAAKMYNQCEKNHAFRFWELQNVHMVVLSLKKKATNFWCGNP